MIEFLGTLLLGGAAGYAAKEMMGKQQTTPKQQNELATLYAENEKFSRRNKELERQVEDLLSELNKVRRQAKANDDSSDDLQDEVDKLKRELKVTRTQNDELSRKVREYKSACEAQEAEIAMLKEKNG